jgi:hypothetical protein
MSQPRTTDPERVLVLAPTPADAALTRTIIADAGLTCHVDTDPEFARHGASARVPARLY